MSEEGNTNLTIIIPTINEEDSLKKLFPLLEDIAPHAKVIVADDGSKDGTKEVCETFEGDLEISFLDRSQEPIHGLTISVLDAIKKTDTGYFIVMDADLQHPPEKVPEMLQKLLDGYDLVVGRRVKVAGHWPLSRRLISWGATTLGKIALFFRRRNICRDIMSGFFGGKTEIFKKEVEENYEKFALKGYKVLFDFLKIHKGKIKIAEVDYVFGLRSTGESKISKKVIWEFFKSLF